MSQPIQAQEPEECYCACHQQMAVVVHPVPCCERCPSCGRRIRRTAIEQHRRRCGRGMSKAP